MSYQGVMNLSIDLNSSPKRRTGIKVDWLKVVKACYEVATENGGKSFGSSFVSKKVEWFPGLRKLSNYHILKRYDYLSNKKETWWLMPDIEGTGKALRKLGII